MQVFGASPPHATSLMLHVYGGALRYYDRQLVEDRVHDRWLKQRGPRRGRGGARRVRRRRACNAPIFAGVTKANLATAPPNDMRVPRVPRCRRAAPSFCCCSPTALSFLSLSSSSSRAMVAARPPTPSRRLSSPRPPPTLQAHSPPPMAPPRIARPPLRPPAHRNRARRHRPDHPHVELPSPVLLRPNRPSEWVALDLLMLTGLPTAALPRQSTAARRAERRLSLLPPSAPLRSPPTPTERTTR